MPKQVQHETQKQKQAPSDSSSGASVVAEDKATFTILAPGAGMKKIRVRKSANLKSVLKAAYPDLKTENFKVTNEAATSDIDLSAEASTLDGLTIVVVPKVRGAINEIKGQI